MSKVKLEVPGIHCGHCKASIEGALQPAEGVDAASVDLDDRSVLVEYRTDVIETVKIVALVEEQGYDVTRFEQVG